MQAFPLVNDQDYDHQIPVCTYHPVDPNILADKRLSVPDLSQGFFSPAFSPALLNIHPLCPEHDTVIFHVFPYTFFIHLHVKYM